MRLALAFLAALALAFGPATVSAAASGCTMISAAPTAMGDMGAPSPMSADPCRTRTKACAAACALVCQALRPLASAAPMRGVAHESVRFAFATVLSPRTVGVRTDTPPPRTAA